MLKGAAMKIGEIIVLKSGACGVLFAIEGERYLIGFRHSADADGGQVWVEADAIAQSLGTREFRRGHTVQLPGGKAGRIIGGNATDGWIVESFQGPLRLAENFSQVHLVATIDRRIDDSAA
jgi:hypothetical protein